MTDTAHPARRLRHGQRPTEALEFDGDLHTDYLRAVSEESPIAAHVVESMGAAANKAAEEGGHYAMQARRFCKGDNTWTDWQAITNVEYERRKGDPSFEFKELSDMAKQVVAADRSSRQVANKAMDIEEGSDIRWVADGQIFGRPTATDLLEMAESRLEDGEMFDCCKSDVRVSEFKRIAELVANKAEVEPFAHLKFRAAQRITTEGDVDANEWYEVCQANEIGDDKLPAFPVFATPPATTGASTARDQALEEAAALVEGCDKRASLRGIAVAIRMLKSSVPASTVLTDERHPWFCAHCQSGVPSINVTFEQEHDPRAGGCGYRVGDWPEREVAAHAGQVAVPEQPTEAMLNAARDWSLKKYGQGIGNDAAIGCWKAMLVAAPSPAKESK